MQGKPALNKGVQQGCRADEKWKWAAASGSSFNVHILEMYIIYSILYIYTVYIFIFMYSLYFITFQTSGLKTSYENSFHTSGTARNVPYTILTHSHIYVITDWHEISHDMPWTLNLDGAKSVKNWECRKHSQTTHLVWSLLIDLWGDTNLFHALCNKREKHSPILGTGSPKYRKHFFFKCFSYLIVFLKT